LSIFLVLPILGVLQHNLAYFAHDGAHFSIFPQSHNVNNFIAQWILFAPFLVDLKSYRKWHNKHHAYIGTEKDPEYELKMLAPKKYAPPAINSIKKIYILDSLGMGAREVILFLKIISDKKAYISIILRYLIVWGTLFGIGILSGLYSPGILISMWTISVFTTFWASLRLRTFYEHYNLDNLSGNKNQNHLTYVGPIPMIVKILTVWWAPYHWHHHKNPAISCFDLHNIKLDMNDKSSLAS